MPVTEVAYSYLRFSSTSQADGDSVRRQNALRDDWLKRHPAIKLDTSLRLVDSGVSGFRGKHRSDKRNSLAQFLELVKRGSIPSGSWLIVESVDRLSREHPEEAVPFMYELIRAHIRIVTLSPTEMVYQAGMDLGRTLMMLMEAFRGHGESARKSDLCGQAWAEIKRHARESKKPMGKNLHPAWVKIEDGKHVLIPDAANAVRTIFKLAANGWSTPKITRHLNEKKVPAIGRKGVWVRSYVQKIISDRSVLGEYQPTRGSDRKVIDGETIYDYWPRVITNDMFQRVQLGRSQRATHKGMRVKRPARIVHAFSGMLTDALDVCPMYTIKSRGRHYIVSQKGYDDPRGDTHRRTFPLDVLQNSLLSRMKELSAADLFADPAAGAVADAVAKVAAIERKLKVAVERFEADPENMTWAAKVDEYDRERREALKELADIRAEVANPLPARWEEAVELMGRAEPERLRQALAGIIEDVRVLIVKRGQTRLCAVQVAFPSGGVRCYLIRWTRCVSLPKCSKPERTEIYSFAKRAGIAIDDERTGLDGFDLREDHDTAERALLTLDLEAGPKSLRADESLPSKVRIWFACLHLNPM